jgi:hypothetical protein
VCGDADGVERGGTVCGGRIRAGSSGTRVPKKLGPQLSIRECCRGRRHQNSKPATDGDESVSDSAASSGPHGTDGPSLLARRLMVLTVTDDNELYSGQSVTQSQSTSEPYPMYASVP